MWDRCVAGDVCDGVGCCGACGGREDYFEKMAVSNFLIRVACSSITTSRACEQPRRFAARLLSGLTQDHSGTRSLIVGLILDEGNSATQKKPPDVALAAHGVSP
jgi:hypothetical protein